MNIHCQQALLTHVDVRQRALCECYFIAKSILRTAHEYLEDVDNFHVLN